MAHHTRPSTVLRLALVGLLLLGLAACKSDEEKIADFMAQGEAYAEEGKVDEAIIEFRNVVQIDPNDADAHYGLAKAFLEKQNFKKAYWELSETVRLDPENAEARLSLAGLMFAVRDFEEALEQVDAVIALGPEDGTPHLVRGQALERLERLDEAEASYRKAAEIGTENHAGLLVTADFLRRQGNIDEAEPLILEYVEKRPGFAAYTALGQFYARVPDRRDEAEAALQKAVESAEDSKEFNSSYANLASLYVSLERTDEAIDLLEKGIEEADEKLDLIYLLARLQRSLGNNAAADALIEKATLAEPDQVAPLLVLSAYRGRSGDMPGALEAANQALALEPENKSVRMRKAELLVDIGYRNQDPALVEEGRGLVEAILVEEPSLPDALFVLAKINLAENDPIKAAENAQDAIAGRPDWAQAHFVLGSALALAGETNSARAALARAVELDPTGLPKARSLLAKLHASLGEHEYAIEMGRAYLREDPADNGTRILVAQSLVRLGRFDEAFEELQKLPEDTRDAEAKFALARLHQARGDIDTAYALLLEADAEQPNQVDVLRVLLAIDRQRDQLDQSSKRIAAALEAKPDEAKLWGLDGTVAVLQRDLDRAEGSFKKGTELDPDDIAIVQQLANLYRLTGRLDETIATYKRALVASPESAQLHHFLAVLYEFGGQTDLAIEEYEAAIRYDGSLGHAKNNLAYLLAERGDDLDRALDLAQEAKALLPDNANAADTLGWVLYKRGVPSAAVGYLKEAEAGMEPTDPNLGIVRHHLALAYEASGEPGKAIETLERALEDLARLQQAARDAGGTPPTPPWETDVRSMADRLRAAG